MVVVTTRDPANLHGQVFYGNKTNILLLWKLENGRKVTDLPAMAQYLISPAHPSLCNDKDTGRLRDEALERHKPTACGTVSAQSPLLGWKVTARCACTLLHPCAENILVTGTPSYSVPELLQHGQDTPGTPKVSSARNAAARESSNSRTGAPGRIPEQGRLRVSEQPLLETKLL